MNDTTLSSQIIRTWEHHHKTMLYLLDHLPAEALDKTLSKRGGRTIAKQLAHIHQVRIMHMETFAKKQGWQFIKFDKDEIPDRFKLIQALEQSGACQNCHGNRYEYYGFRFG